jgi:hypothetical protein
MNEAKIRAQFEEATKDHAMEVLRDDGLYRHLQFRAPGTYIYSYDLVTWPGYLAINGDLVSGYTFARIPDMFEFFGGSGSIDLRYWAEKITNPDARAATKKYDEDADFDPYRDDERPWEWNSSFVFSCFAIRAGIEQYNASREPVPA